ncbi:MAG TPA: DUF4175 family protein [Acidobacteriaceae bacterium]|nr:DUF4175 family protein [Acidobacteriaceae bacterium]
MSTRGDLNSYIQRLERRLRMGVILRGAAVLAAAALGTTVVLVLILNLFAFSHASVGGGRAVLIALLALAVAFFLAIPLSRLNRRSAVGRAESQFPQLNQRLVTFAERDRNADDPFLDLLAADTLDAVREATPTHMVPNGRLLALAGGGLAALGVLLWVTLAGPGWFGYGASLLWAGQHAGKAPYYDIHITPGNVTVRRNADQLITALPVGVQTNQVRLYARYQNGTQWQQVSMQPRAGASGFQFLFAGLTQGLEYYVEAGAVHSRHYSIRVVDMPSVKRIRVNYRYPSWAGLKDVTEEQGGDLRALQGTKADLDVITDRPLKQGVLILDDGTQIPLTGGQGNVYKGTIAIQKDGIYHVAAPDHGEMVRLSGDYFIEANPPQPPEVEVDRPGRDYHASPIEEVTVAVKASDDYGLKGLALHYSVNGGPDQTVDLLKQKGAKQADGSTTLSLENFKLVPGDVISLYATAKDARADAHTDIFFVQADPFERDFTQSQTMGGGGGGGGGGQGNQPGDISQREKEIIAATWKQQGDKSSPQQQAASTADFLSGVQSKLADQAQSLSYRLQSREMDEDNEEFSSFVHDMNDAVQAMGPAADKLKQKKWREAMPSEQKALQSLLRAEATFREIEVAFGNRGGGGGGGGGGSAGRDLASLFDLELDTQKNTYETAQTADSSTSRSQQVDDALRKLDDLARRQQELADQQRNQTSQSVQDRWQQEMLKRNAEELQRELQQLAQNQQGGQQGSQQSGQQSGQQGSQQASQLGGAQGASGQSSASGGQSSGSPSQQASQQEARRALDQLRQATDAMNRAGSGQDRDGAARQAADRLRDATSSLGGLQQQQASGRLDGMARDADQLKNEEQAQDESMRKFFTGQQGEGGASQNGQSRNYQQTYQQVQQLANDRQQLSDGLTQLRRQMQQAERELAPTQRSAASKLRDALGQVDSSDLMTRTQHSADWLRRGIDPASNGSEASLGSGFQQLSQQIHEAQQALGSGNGNGDGQQQQDTQNALEQVRRLRDQLQGANGLSRNGQNGRDGQQGRNGQRGQNGQQQAQAGQNGQAGRGGQNGQGNAPGQGNQPGQLARNGQQGQRGQGGANGQIGQNGQLARNDQNGGAMNGRAGDARGGGDNRGGNIDGGWDTGNNSNLPQPVAPDSAAPPPDTEAAVEQELGELHQVQQSVQNDPEMLNQVQQLIREMQGLDPRRFPGNPEVYEQLHTQVLADVDKLELRLTTAQQSGQIRSTAGDAVPAGYQDAVAEYFRQLSKGH